MKGVRKGKGDIIFDESRLLVPRGIHNGLKFPGGFEGFEQRRGGGCDSLTREDDVNSRAWSAPQRARLTFTDSYGKQMTVLTKLSAKDRKLTVSSASMLNASGILRSFSSSLLVSTFEPVQNGMNLS